MLQVGESFPDVQVIDDAGLPFRTSDLLGSWHLIYWYPKADTPGCTAQAQSLKAQIDSFDELGCQVIGVSFDPPQVNARFRLDYRLPFTLLSDVDQHLAAAVGALGAGAATPGRIAHLMDRDGIAVAAYDVSDPGFFAETVLDDLELLGDVTAEAHEHRD